MTAEEIKAAVREVLEEERKQFWVSPETHYQHHEYLEGWIWMMGIAKKSIVIAFATGVVSGLLGLVWLGFQAVVKVKGVVAG